MKLYLTSGKLLGQSPHNGHEMDTTIIRQLLLAQFHQIFTQIGKMHVTAFQHNCTNLHTVAISLLYSAKGLSGDISYLVLSSLDVKMNSLPQFSHWNPVRFFESKLLFKLTLYQ